MTFLKDTIEYLKDNPDGLWFKRKLYGWGWVPVKWQGFAVIAIFIVFLLFNSRSFTEGVEPTSDDLFWFFARFVIAIVLLILICYKKGESPRWQWGPPKK